MQTKLPIAETTSHPARAGNSSRREQALVALGRRAIAAPCWRLLAHDAAALVAETLDVSHFAVAELSDDKATLALQWTMRDRLSSAVRTLESNSIACASETSLAAFALAKSQPVISADISGETRFSDAALGELGLASAVAVPLHMESAAYGALILADVAPRAFPPEEVQFIEAITHLVSTTIAHDNARRLLTDERRQHAALLDSSASLILRATPQGRLTHMNRAASAVTGFALRDFAERPMWNVLLVAEEVAGFRQAFDRLSDRSGPQALETWIVTQSGERRRIAWSLAHVSGGEHGATSILLSGVDISRQHEMAIELQAVRATTVTSSETAQPQPFAALTAEPHADRRERLRRAFPYVQRIAPIVDGCLPEPEAFRSVRCRDIAAAGFSYFAPDPPDYQDLVVALGTPASPTFLTARVMHATIVEREGKIVYIVGCRYLSRSEAAVSG